MESLNNKRKKLISKMRISPEILLKLARKGGKIGEIAARLDSWQSRSYDKGKGVYAELDSK